MKLSEFTAVSVVAVILAFCYFYNRICLENTTNTKL